MGTSADTTLTAIEQAFKTIVWTPMITAGEVLLDGVQAGVPVINTAVFEGLEDDAIQAITDAMFNQLILFIDVEYIQFKNAALQTAWASSVEQLTILSQEQGVNSDAYKQALAAEAAAFAKLVHTGP